MSPRRVMSGGGRDICREHSHLMHGPELPLSLKCSGHHKEPKP